MKSSKSVLSGVLSSRNQLFAQNPQQTHRGRSATSLSALGSLSAAKWIAQRSIFRRPTSQTQCIKSKVFREEAVASVVGSCHFWLIRCEGKAKNSTSVNDCTQSLSTHQLNRLKDKSTHTRHLNSLTIDRFSVVHLLTNTNGTAIGGKFWLV